MTSPLLRRLAVAALVLLVMTLLAIDYSFTSFVRAQQPPLDRAATIAARRQIILIALGGALLALGIAFGVSRSLSLRVSGLKRAVQRLPGSDAQDFAPAASGDDLGSLELSLSGVADELRRLLDRMSYESARRDAILTGMTEGVLAVDHDLRVAFCNTALLRAMGFRGTTYEGLSLLELVRDSGLYELLRSVVTTAEPQHLRLRLSAGNARVFEVQATQLPMPSGRGAIAIVHDTTELERLEQVRKDFVANVSHELRTPLAGIIGYADTLLDGALEDQQNNRRFVEIIRTNAVRLSSIASDLLVLSELESGQDPQESEIISLRGVLDGALITVQAEARLRQVLLISEGIETVYVAGSRLRLEQALLNLLANAIKFNRPGGEVRVRARVNGEEQVEIQVADTGVGIPSEELPRIFERFYRVDKARSRQVGGTGLGLSIVKHVVERMHGVVRVESQLGKGTTFTLLLPFAAEPKAGMEL
ncbi:MAG TPA: ATP-binding protein [Bryobacteraceae bacterium]|jgi:two-component system phosphate regulon sensor histidine kinase PhoR|nr:ATP-binding protein [Bryobacteraceae bacterium]